MEFKGEKEFNFGKPLHGHTLGASLRLGKSNAVVVSAAGGEFRVVFSQGEAETRDNHCTAICFVLGQKSNTRACIGFANPATPPFIHTREHPDGLVSGELTQFREWWFGVDKETGWAFLGAGGTLGQRVILSASFPNHGWTHVSFSNWAEPVKLTVKSLSTLPALHASQKKFNKFGQLVRFEGVTTVSPIRMDQPLAQVMLTIQNLIRTNPLLAPHYALLPPSSFHSTMFDLFSCVGADYDKNASDLDARFLSMREAVFQSRNLLPSSLTFLPTGMNCNCALVMLDPDDRTAQALAKWREVLGAKVKVVPNPDYEFHATLMYQLYPTSSFEAHSAFKSVLAAANAMVRALGPITLAPPDFCRFKDMGEFRPS